MGFMGLTSKTTGVHVLNVRNVLKLYTEALFLWPTRIQLWTLLQVLLRCW